MSRCPAQEPGVQASWVPTAAYRKEARASPLQSAQVSDLCYHIPDHMLPAHHILVHDPNGSGMSAHGLLCLTFPFFGCLEHGPFITLNQHQLRPPLSLLKAETPLLFPGVYLSAMLMAGTQRTVT